MARRRGPLLISVSYRLPPDLIAEIERRAEAQGISINAMLIAVIKAGLVHLRFPSPKDNSNSQE